MSVRLQPDFCIDEVFFHHFPIHRACRDGDINTLVSLSQSNRAHLTAEDSCYGWTPIHWAAHYGQLECVVHLVQMGCEVNVASSRFSQTPAHTAAFGGRPHCIMWLTQAGADVNKQDCVGETPIHKAARSGSLECIQVLLTAGAKPHLRNASGQTAADLAHAHGFHDCFCFISDDQKHLQVNVVHGGSCVPHGDGLLSRKRQLTAVETHRLKKAKRADAPAATEQLQSSSADEVENMHLEQSSEPASTKAVANQCHQSPPSTGLGDLEPPPPSGGDPSQHTSAAMCGSLHVTGSPGSSLPHQSDWGKLTGEDCGDLLHYGYYHGFGDTAEDLSDSSCIQAVHICRQSVHPYHGS